MDSIYLLQVNNGQDFEEYRDWPWTFMDDRILAELRVERLNHELVKLYDAVREHQYKTDYAKMPEDTAPGKRYMKFLKEHKLVNGLHPKYHVMSRLEVTVQEVKRL